MFYFVLVAFCFVYFFIELIPIVECGMLTNVYKKILIFLEYCIKCKRNFIRNKTT